MILSPPPQKAGVGEVPVRSGNQYATNSGRIPYPESAYDGKKNDYDYGQCRLAVRVRYHIDVYSQSLDKGKEDYHHW